MIPRKDWIRALSAFPADEIRALIAANFGECDVTHHKIPQSGLGLLRMKDGAKKEHYYLGEIPLSSAVIEITTPSGETAQGAANVMHSSKQFAIDLAICDAVLANEISHWQVIEAKVFEGFERVKQRDQIRSKMLSRSTVDFSLLSDAEESETEVENG